MERERLVCPACGAGQKQMLSPDALQTVCEYCGSVILVPRRLTGLTRRCHNHPDSLAMGVCHDCGRIFCEDCLVVWTYRRADMYVCLSCRNERTRTRRLEFWSFVATGGFLLCIALVVFLFSYMQHDPLTGRPTSSSIFLSVVGLFLLMTCPICMCLGLLEWAQSGVTRTLKQELGNSTPQ